MFTLRHITSIYGYSEVICMNKQKTTLVILSTLLLLFIVATIVLLTLENGKIATAFKANMKTDSNLKTASEIDYQEYIENGIEDVKDGYSIEWILNHWYYGFEPKTVIYESVDIPKVDTGEEATSMLKWIEDYSKSLLGTEDLTLSFMNYMGDKNGCYKFKNGDREYLICCSVTKETEEGKITVFHSEVIQNETE